MLPCVTYSFDSIAGNFCLLALPFILFKNKRACWISKGLIRANVYCFSTSAKQEFLATSINFSSKEQESRIEAIIKKAEKEHLKELEKTTRRALLSGMSENFLAGKAGTT